MDVNDPILLGLNLIQLVSPPIMLAMFGFAVWYGVWYNDDR